jgi:tetratricopeptide (TPR) repeat protein
VLVRTGEQLEVSDAGGSLACPDPGTYTFRIYDDGTLRFTPVQDACEGRRMVITFVEWANRDRFDEYQQAIINDPNDALAHISSGRLRLILGDSADALEDLDRALEFAPNIASAYAGRATWKMVYAEDLRGALADFDLAVECAPDDGLRYFQHAWVKHQLGDRAGTCDDLRAAIGKGLHVEQQYRDNCR